MNIKHEQKLEHIIHMFIVKFMEENYQSGNITNMTLGTKRSREVYTADC